MAAGRWIRCKRWCTAVAVALACALSAAGCANCRLSLPRIDPTGERLFLPCGTPPPVHPTTPPIPGIPIGSANPPPSSCGISVSPNQIVAPVGSEVVMIASLCGGDNHLAPHQKIEWMLAPDGAGQFISPGQIGTWELLNWLHGPPKKVDSRYVINQTHCFSMTLDRGTPSPADDVLILPGQAWVTVSSPTEGTSVVTAFAPRVAPWDRRQQSATIFWVDAQWRFPPPAITPVGGRHTLVTVLNRQTDGSPLAGWQVRYQITGGPDAGFAPDGAPMVEVLSGPNGEAVAEILQKQPGPGTNQISMQVLRPATAAGRAVPLGTGSTLQTWTSSEFSISVAGPPSAAVGATITYQLELNNPADTAAGDVVVADQCPPQLEFVDSTPPAAAGPTGREWRIGEVAPHGRATIAARYRVAEAGAINYCATASSDRGTTTRSCITTRVGGGAAPPVIPTTPAPPTTPAQPTTPTGAADLEVRITGPDTAVVGSQASFKIEVTNRGTARATQVLVKDRFDVGLGHVRPGNSIENDLVDIEPGATAGLAVTLQIQRAGELCQDITVTAAGGVQGTARHCITATPTQPAEAPAQPEQPAEPPAQPAQPPTQPPSAVTPPPGASPLKLTLSGPPSKEVGDFAVVTLEIVNQGATELENLEIANHYESSLQPSQATVGYERLTGNALGWKVTALGPGKRIKREVEFKCLRETPQACNRVTVTATGIAEVKDEVCLKISGTGGAAAEPAAGAGGAVSVTVAETADPIKVGEVTTFQIQLSNDTMQSLYDVKVTVTYDDVLQLDRIDGPVHGSVLPGTVRFDAIREFRSGENPLSIELRMKGVRPGTSKFHVEAVGRDQDKPVTANQTTEVLATE